VTLLRSHRVYVRREHLRGQTSDSVPDAASKRAGRARRTYLWPYGSAERLGELDRLVDHDLVGDIGASSARTAASSRIPRSTGESSLGLRSSAGAISCSRPPACSIVPGGGARSTWSRPCQIPDSASWRLEAGRASPETATRTGPAARARASGAAPISFVALAMFLPRFAISPRLARPCPFAAARALGLLSLSVVRMPFATGTPRPTALREARGRSVRDDVNDGSRRVYRAERDQASDSVLAMAFRTCERRLERAPARNHRERVTRARRALAAGLEHRDADSLVEARATIPTRRPSPLKSGLISVIRSPASSPPFPRSR